MYKRKSARDLVQEALAQAKGLDEVGAEQLVIWGGAFPADQLEAFLAAWGDTLVQLEWRLYEYVSRFKATRVSADDPALPDDTFDLERARLFGELGDLDLRRDGDRFCWRFIGEPSEAWPVLTGSFEPRDFWREQEKPPTFCMVEQRYYQWRMGDERVSTKWLEGLGLTASKNNCLVQRHYLDRGTVAFVRYVKFEEA